MRQRGLYGVIAVLMFGLIGLVAPATAVPVATLSSAATKVLDLPLTNRDASVSPGGVNPALPTKSAALATLLKEVRAAKIAPPRYAALLYQYWLVRSTEAAGIDLAKWNPRTGVTANRANLVRSYRYYENLQLKRRELQWAGMAGQVGADFGGGLEDFELATNIFDWPGLSRAANQLISAILKAAGPDAVNSLPAGLPALARVGATVKAADLRWILGMILVMQKNIFSDLMPLHTAYVAEGMAPIKEMVSAGLYPADMLDHWNDVASGKKDRIARGNAALLQREQGVVIREQWDVVRNYKGDVGEAVTYLSTLMASPSVAGVLPPRETNPAKIVTKQNGRTVTVTVPVPDWNWSSYPDRWKYITQELLPKYADMVNNKWLQLVMVMLTPYDIQMESHRPLAQIPGLLMSMAKTLKVTVS